MNPEGKPTNQGFSMTQKVFQMKLDLLFELQKYEHQSIKFHKEYFEELRNELYQMIRDFNRDRILVRDSMPVVDKYSVQTKWDYLSKFDIQEIKNELTLLVDSDKDLESAKAFDLKIYYIMLSLVSEDVVAKKAKEQVVRISQALLQRLSIPQVAKKQRLLEEVMTQTYWNNANLEVLERLRDEMRDLIQYITDEVGTYSTDFKDVLIDQGTKEFNIFDFKTYEEKVIDYLLVNWTNESIIKIKMMDKIDANDLKELERILWNELGSKDDYFNETSEENLAVFIRRLVGIEQEAINKEFSKYLATNILSAKQQEFVKSIINYVQQNGDITKQDLVEKSPFSDFDVVNLFKDKIQIVVDVVDHLHNRIIVS